MAELLEYTLDKGAGPMGWEGTKSIGWQEGKGKGWEGAGDLQLILLSSLDLSSGISVRETRDIPIAFYFKDRETSYRFVK